MVFSVMLIAPSWGGMINGLLTLRGAWGRVRSEPILKFFVAALTFYGMATFEGPLLSIKSVSAIGHYTDWIIAHVHGGTLGWNGFITFAMVYWLVPRLWKTPLYSERLANVHFWTGFLGTIIYIVSMWVAGVTQGLMWRALEPSGRLTYPDFLETVLRITPLYALRAVGGGLYLVGFAIMFYNVWRTVKAAPKTLADETVSAPALAPATYENLGARPHRKLEGLPLVFSILAFLAVIVGTAIELVPAFLAGDYVEASPNLRPYTALQLEGRDIYVREGCYLCHSQMIRPLAPETLRYGDYSRAEESVYDKPFQWGSKRTGPDLARVGGKYPDLWHFRHMMDPRDVSPGSIMPAYPWLFRDKVDFALLGRKLKVMKMLQVPYTDDEVRLAGQSAHLEAEQIATALKTQGAPASIEDKEIIAVIAYLQRLGQDHKKGIIK
jgi:cytochrome c oxidase cbb3-type subunit I/II